jgi:two-component system response regulator HydG
MEEGIKILVVDDDRRMVKTICDILTVKGHQTLQAYTGEEAVAVVKSEGPDCVLMDIKMPRVNGVEALKMIKEISPELPVVLMSAFASDVQVAAAQKLGAYTVLDKPFDIQMVLSFLSLLRREESILVVDDDPAFCQTLKDILQARGCSVDAETDPEKVLGHMEEDYKLVVLLNLKLDNTKGLDVLKNIRAKYPTKPVLLATAYGVETADAIKEGFQIGAYTALYKPLEIESLVGVIKEIRRKKLSAVLGEPFEMPQRTPNEKLS